jgi:acyl carrier protein
MQNVEEEIRGIIAEIIEKTPAEVTPDARFFEDLGVDSMMALEIMAAIEKKYKIAIPEDKLAQLTTLKDTVAVARQFLDSKGASNA